ncbi:hypothetical protein C8R26_1448 [Nitrosomonas oligotropha]|uniref:Uncharacterized protein n=1 Tax=Nitrosomonas oligotropha TaxID=42354 RepID=A0A2T5H611_9PROT|nr:hypothetical protein C8R26_1448 [Nitrosomonas oligotropha]
MCSVLVSTFFGIKRIYFPPILIDPVKTYQSIDVNPVKGKENAI